MVAGKRPRPLSDEVRSRMERQGRRDTKPELELRSFLHRMGLRFRVDVSAVPGSRRRVDIKFGPAKVAVLVHGCFWHRCPEHGTIPTNNRQWWIDKLDSNVARDRATIKELEAGGWLPVIVWEHDDLQNMATKIYDTVVARRCRDG